MGDKKRKRHSSGQEKPRKRVEIEVPKPTVKVQFVEPHDDVGPIVGIS